MTAGDVESNDVGMTAGKPTASADQQALAEMPLRYWLAVDTGALSLERALALWSMAKSESATGQPPAVDVAT